MTAVAHESYLIATTYHFEKRANKNAVPGDANSTLDQELLVLNDMQI